MYLFWAGNLDVRLPDLISKDLLIQSHVSVCLNFYIHLVLPEKLSSTNLIIADQLLYFLSDFFKFDLKSRSIHSTFTQQKDHNAILTEEKPS